MANIFDYLNWRSDLTFDADPFNDVDNLVLAELSYTDFDGVVPGPGEGFLPVGEVRRKYFSIHTPEEIRARTTFYKDAAFLMQHMEDTPRFGDLKIGNYINDIEEDADAQISAVTFLLGDKEAYIAFRGTDDTIVGWKEDLNFSYMSETTGQRKACEYLKKVCSMLPEDMPIRVGGHSKGGNFAAYAAMHVANELGERLRCVYSNDGPGFRSEVAKSDAFRAILPKIHSTIPENSIVGILLSTVRNHHIVRSDESGPMQHNAFSWQVMGNHFVEAERGRGSVLFDQSIRTWIDGLKDSEKKEWIDTLFSFFDEAGISTLTEFRQHSLTGAINILKAMHGLKKDEQEKFLQVIYKFKDASQKVLEEEAKSGITAYLEDLKNNEESLAGIIREAFQGLSKGEDA